jgi:hypothetical protein
LPPALVGILESRKKEREVPLNGASRFGFVELRAMRVWGGADDSGEGLSIGLGLSKWSKCFIRS